MLLEHGSSPRGLEMRVVMVMMVMMVMMVVMIVEILRELRIGFSLRRLGFVYLLEEGERVGDGLEQSAKDWGFRNSLTFVALCAAACAQSKAATADITPIALASFFCISFSFPNNSPAMPEPRA